MGKDVMVIDDVLRKLGLPQFEIGEDGYPVPGQVVKYFREQMIYVDREGHEKHWTQKDLAEKLGISEIMVNLMEKRNKGLNSIERRRVLSSILKIPPVLLGLGSLDQIVSIITGQALPQSENRKQNREIHVYQQNYKTYKQMYRDGLSYMVSKDIENNTLELEQLAKNVAPKETILYLLWQYEILCAKVYGSDLCDWNKTFEHIDNAKDIATYLDDRDLQAASLCHAAIFRLRQGRLGLAKIEIEGARFYAKGATPETKGIIFSKSACISSQEINASGLVHHLQHNVTLFHLLDEAEKYTEAPSETHTISFGKDDFLLDKAYVLNALQRPGKSLEVLDHAERYIRSTGKRHMMFLDIQRAKYFIEQKKPEYEQALFLLITVLEEHQGTRVARNIQQVAELYKRLAGSPYGNSPDVVELGIALRKIEAM